MSAIGDEEISASLWVLLDTAADRDKRRSAFRRSTSQTDVFSNQIDRMAEPIRIIRYDPMEFNPDDTRITVERGTRSLSDGGVRLKSLANTCNRLDPLDHVWGYSPSEVQIRGVFEPESDDISMSFTHDKTSMTYQSTSRLVAPVEYDDVLQRFWSLFSEAFGSDVEQYKRTVFIFERNNEWWALQDIVAPPLGKISTYLECELIQLHNADAGSQQFYNPFAFTYEQGSNKPYAKYPCEIRFPFEEIADSSGSEGSGVLSS